MSITRKVAFVGAVGLSAVLLVAGCESSTGNDSAAKSISASATGLPIAEDVPSGFKPCTDIPQAVLDSEGLHRNDGATSHDDMVRGKVKWRGCIWVVSDGYSATISTTNLTLDMVRAKQFPDQREVAVAGRTALLTHQSQDSTNKTTCTLNAQMQGGSLEFKVDNPASRKKTGNRYSCDIALALAEKVVPLIPAGV
ncbi:DUF3558 domain-containing protein [Nocardia sp. NPDC050710]|uniref:DUF3558 domain-containing protein n=1 Tax=Nocardia sp. NPDC050710 TaxID=3157220 RepID=UPI0034089E97